MERLISKRLLLREWKKSDSKDLYEYGKSKLVGPNAGWPIHKDEKESEEIIEMFIKSNNSYAIVLKSENKVIGGIGLHDRKPDESLTELKQREIGYVLNPKYWGRGIAPEALDCLMKYAFNKLNLDLIWCGHFDFNTNSKRVIEKCGLKYKFKKNEKLKLMDNVEVNTLYYNISKSEYIDFKNRVIIRKVNKYDAAPLIDYFNLIGGETDFLTFGMGQFDRNVKEEEQFIESTLNKDNSLFIIAEKEGEIVGNLNFSGGLRKRKFHVGEFGVSVPKKYWGNGVGEDLILYLINWSKKTGKIKKINLKVREDNEKGIYLYKKLGFIEECLLKREFLVEDKFYDAITMGLLID